MSISYRRGRKVFQLDAEEFKGLVGRLTGEELRKSAKSGLRRSGKELVQETEKRFGRLVVKHKGKGKGRLTGLNYRGRKLPIATTKIYDKKKELQPMATVSIRNRRTDFRAQFFELGTKPRYTRKAYRAKGRLRNRKSKDYPAGMYRGSIMAGRYFRRAQQASATRVFKIMGETINGHIIRQARNKV